jgi:hypothetical protein
MKSITVRMGEEDYERLRERAYKERGSVSGKAMELLVGALRREGVKQVIKAAKEEAVKPEVKDAGIDAEKEKGVEVFEEEGESAKPEVLKPVNTVAEVKQRVAELAARKSTGLLSGVPYGRVTSGPETAEEKAKRLDKAHKEQLKRAGK